MNKIITYQQLLDKKACAEQRSLFKKLFGSQVELTESLVLEHYQSFDINWASRYLLSPTSLAEYEKICAPAWAEYDKVCALAWDEYQKVRALALAEYDKVCALAWDEYQKVRALAWAEYEKACALAWAEYKKVCALVFFKMYEG